MSEYKKAAIDAAKIAGGVLLENASTDLGIRHKGEIDLVTRMDIESERIIVGLLRERFPDHGIIGEEGDAIKQKSDYVWIIDPLDGTTNYAHRLPWYAVSIALHKNGEPLCGVVYNPAFGEMFHAEKGGGAYLNDNKIKVSDISGISESLLATGFSYNIRQDRRAVEDFNRFIVLAQGIRRFGAASLDLAYVAFGRYEGYWEKGLKPWDTAAGMIILTEAGGRITDYSGGKFDIFGKTLLASNGLIHQEMMGILKESGAGEF